MTPSVQLMHETKLLFFLPIEKVLCEFMLSTDNPEIPFPPVAGYAGVSHLYKVYRSATAGWLDGCLKKNCENKAVKKI